MHTYYEGVINGQEYRLSSVQKRFNEKRYKDLDTEDRRRLDDSIIHTTIIRQDEPTEDQSSIYTIFERLNTGGVNLQPQEIRVALYHGEFVRVLEDLNNEKAWRQLYGAESRRLKDMEMILRFLAFLYYAEQYERPMKTFLNRYMATNRHLKRQPENELREIFTRTTQNILQGIGAVAFRPKRAVNAAVVDSVMTGVARRLLARGPITDLSALKAQFDVLMKNEVYMASIETGTSDEANVNNRLGKVTEAFSVVP